MGVQYPLDIMGRQLGYLTALTNVIAVLSYFQSPSILTFALQFNPALSQFMLKLML